MCDKCSEKEHKKFWVHIADQWSPQETGEMLEYLDYIRTSDRWKRLRSESI